jgi:transcriptional regulator with GAF, ATPase, and Fis domain
MMGNSPALRKLAEQVALVAPTNSTILVLGESGVGKERVARELHRRSQHADRLLIKVNCAAVSPVLFESELFGHSKGVFTGALRDRTVNPVLAQYSGRAAIVY